MLLGLIGAIIVGLSLGLLGSGGSILTVPVLVYVLGHADKPAIAESMAIVGGIALIGAIPGLTARRVDWHALLSLGIPAVVGTWLGAWVSLWVPGVIQLLLFALVMLGAAVMMLRGTPMRSAAGSDAAPRTVLLVVEGLAVGALTGLVGVGGGFLLVPALVLLARLDMHRAVATSLVIIAMKCAIGSWEYLRVLHELDMQVDWTTIGLFILVGGIGAILGMSVGLRIDQRTLKRTFGILLVVMSVLIAGREGMRLADGGRTPGEVPGTAAPDR